MLRRAAMTALVSSFVLPFGVNARAQTAPAQKAWPVNPEDPNPLADNPTNSSAVQESSGPIAPTTTRTAVVQFYDPATIATIAPTAGISGTSRPFAPNATYAQIIDRTVNPNAFRPSDDIADVPVITLPSTRVTGCWDVSASVTEWAIYDSNITRGSDAEAVGDFYERTVASANFRLGTNATPLAMDLAYNYTADLFDRLTSFDTYTHNVNFQGRIGRSNLIFSPYVTSSFRSVDNPSGFDTGRESYDYIQAGLRGQDTITPNIIHTYDFSHTSVDYQQRTGENFETWELYQEVDIKPCLRLTPSLSASSLDNITVFPWLDLKQTSPQDQLSVNEISGGMGGLITFDGHLSLQAKVGWGDVESDSPSVSDGKFSGWRYSTELDYAPIHELRLRLSYNRVLSFSPATVGRSVDILDFVIEAPLEFGSHFVVTPALEISRTASNDYADKETSFFPQPSLQLSYTLNEHVAFFGKTQYRTTEDNVTNTDTNVRVLQTSVGMTATF